MKTHRGVFILLLVALVVGSALTARAASTAKSRHQVIEKPVSEDYRIGSGDILQVTVWKEPELSVPSVIVRPDGKVSLPLIKDVVAEGRTPAELEHQVVTGIEKFIHDPEVAIVVKEIHSKKIYLVGAVHKTGAIPLDYQMNVLQAIAEAGGLTEFAKSRHIYILRMSSGSEQRLPFNYDAVIKGKMLEQNVFLRAGDTVVVPN